MQIINQLRQQLTRKDNNRLDNSIWRILHLDVPLLFSLFALIIFGFFILYSASNQQFSMVAQEIMHISLALIVMFAIAQLPPYVYERWTPWLYGTGVFLLFAVLIVGHINKGAQRWLNFGLFHLQPSEIMQLAVPMMLAWYYKNRNLPPSIKDLFISALIIIIPVILTVKEPDLGTAAILILGGACVLLFAGISWNLILGLFSFALISIPILWHFMHAYQRQRISIFFNPERDPLGNGYHIIQSKIAIGSGGFFGKGWLMGTQSHLHFLPEHATDFIFAVTGEEFGFFGSMILLAIYLLITARCMHIANHAQDTYTRLLAASLSLMFFLSVFINIGMVSGILPVVGLPLPLISYGGSSMIALMAGFGILMSIHGHKKLLAK
jgi:rod shape determining protein RodA